jgi:hypothetical protein
MIESPALAGGITGAKTYSISASKGSAEIIRWDQIHRNRIGPIPDTALNYIPTTADQLILEDGSITITHGRVKE